MRRGASGEWRIDLPLGLRHSGCVVRGASVLRRTLQVQLCEARQSVSVPLLRDSKAWFVAPMCESAGGGAGVVARQLRDVTPVDQCTSLATQRPLNCRNVQTGATPVDQCMTRPVQNKSKTRFTMDVKLHCLPVAHLSSFSTHTDGDWCFQA